MAALTTPERVRGIAAHLAQLTDPQLAVYIEDAAMDVAGYKIKKTEYTERLERYLAAHMATLNIRRAISQKVADMSKSYDARSVDKEGLKSTEYGLEFLRLLQRADGPNLNLTVM